jgi:hypothetical protein
MRGQSHGIDFIVCYRNNRGAIRLVSSILSHDPSMARGRQEVKTQTLYCPRCGGQVGALDAGRAARITSRSVGVPKVFKDKSTEEFICAEIWLKVIVHLAGIAALLATPSVAALFSN